MKKQVIIDQLYGKDGAQLTYHRLEHSTLTNYLCLYAGTVHPVNDVKCIFILIFKMRNIIDRLNGKDGNLTYIINWNLVY